MAILYSHALADPSSIFKPPPKEKIPESPITFSEVTGLQGAPDLGFYRKSHYPAQDVFRFAISVNYFEFKKFMRSNGFIIGPPESLQHAPQSMFESVSYSDGIRPRPLWIWQRPTRGFYIKTVSKDKKYILHIIYQPGERKPKPWSKYSRILYIQTTPNKSGG